MDSIERASTDEIRHLQLERLRWALRHAYASVAHYHRSFDACGAHPDDLRTLEDLRRFPFLTKQDFRDNYPFGLFAVPRQKLGANGSESAVKRMASELSHNVKAYVGISITVQTHEPGALERSMGKAKRILDRRLP